MYLPQQVWHMQFNQWWSRFNIELSNSGKITQVLTSGTNCRMQAISSSCRP